MSLLFKYLGDGVNKKTTTYQIDNVMIGSKIPEGEGLKADVAFDLKVFDGKKWNNADKNVLVLSVQDYKEMGQNQYCFSEKVPAADYLPELFGKGNRLSGRSGKPCGGLSLQQWQGGEEL